MTDQDTRKLLPPTVSLAAPGGLRRRVSRGLALLSSKKPLSLMPVSRSYKARRPVCGPVDFRSGRVRPRVAHSCRCLPSGTKATVPLTSPADYRKSPLRELLVLSSGCILHWGKGPIFASCPMVRDLYHVIRAVALGVI